MPSLNQHIEEFFDEVGGLVLKKEKLLRTCDADIINCVGSGTGLGRKIELSRRWEKCCVAIITTNSGLKLSVIWRDKMLDPNDSDILFSLSIEPEIIAGFMLSRFVDVK